MTPLVPELYSADINATRALYVETLGFSVKYERPEHKFMYLEREGAEIMFQQIGADREWITGSLEKPFGRGVSFQIETSDVDALYKKAKEANCTIFLDMEEKWYRCNDKECGNRQFIIQDQDGYLMRFFKDLGYRA